MTDILEVDEILCFISNKLDSVPNDQLVTICVNSFEATDIKSSKLRLFKKVGRGPDDVQPSDGGIKFIARKGANCTTNNVQDIITLFLELGSDAPSFAAVNLNRMPPISIESVDIKALLKLVETLSTDVSTLKKCVHTQQKTISEMHDAMAAQRAQNDQIMTYASATASVPDSRRAAPSDTGNPPTGNRQNNAAPSGTGNAPIANDNQNGNGSVITTILEVKLKIHPVLGGGILLREIKNPREMLEKFPVFNATSGLIFLSHGCPQTVRRMIL